MSAGSSIRIRLDASPDRRAALHWWSGYPLRSVGALLGLVLIVIAELYGIAASSQIQQPAELTLFSCGGCHD